MTLPTSVRIGGKRFTILLKADRDMDDIRGRILYEHQEIWLSDGQCEDSMRETLLHELLHSAINMAGLDIDDATSTNVTTERSVTSVSKILFGILRDNPRVTTWLLTTFSEEIHGEVETFQDPSQVQTA